jgi:uncharacterized protein (DUF1015 family)
MAILKPFKAFRPMADKAHLVASKPYDVINTSEAKAEAKVNALSFLHIVKPEIDFPEGQNPYAPEIYNKGRDNFKALCEKGVMIQDETDSYYIYMLEKDGRQQTGIVGCAGIEDYFNDVILKHELTRPDKEEDRKNHIRVTNMNAEPVFFAFRAVKKLDELVEGIKKGNTVYDLVAADEVRHVVWRVEDQAAIDAISRYFDQLDHTYVADGHHRTAAAALVGRELQNKNRYHQGIEEYNYFMAVHFPDNQLQIIDYNRIVKDLNGLSRETFLDLLGQSFEIKSNGPAQYKPGKLHEFSMYLEGNWFILMAKEGTFNDKDPIGVLDVTILSEQILKPILGIEDLRTDKRIDFVGGTRGLGELEKRVNSGDMKVAFALYPVTIQQLMDISDSDQIMPPKTTWFEPKLASGLLVHMLE